MDIPKLFASIVFRTVGLQQFLHLWCSNVLLQNISSSCCHVVGKWPFANDTVALGEE